MKKSLLALLLAVALAVPALAENMWIGGNFSYDNDSPKNGDSTSSIYIAPEFGYNLNEKVDIGLDVFYGYDEGAGDQKRFGVEPFIRYKMFEIGGFSFLAKGKIYYENCKNDEMDVNINSYGISIVPVVTYSINEKWSINASLDFARIYFESIKCDEDESREGTRCGLSGNRGDIYSIGFAYHF